MLSTFPTMLSSFENPLPFFEGCFTPWDYQEPPCIFKNQEPVVSPKQTPEAVFSNSGSDNSNPNSNSGSDEPNRPVSVIDERKRRRMISNRESARRSRMRKQKHLENLRNQANRLKIGNREIMNQLRLATHNCQLVRRDNDLLRSESAMLRQKLWDMNQVLLVRQLQPQLLSPAAWPCNNVTPINEIIPPSLIT